MHIIIQTGPMAAIDTYGDPHPPALLQMSLVSPFLLALTANKAQPIITWEESFKEILLHWVVWHVGLGWLISVAVIKTL